MHMDHDRRHLPSSHPQCNDGNMTILWDCKEMVLSCLKASLCGWLMPLVPGCTLNLIVSLEGIRKRMESGRNAGAERSGNVNTKFYSWKRSVKWTDGELCALETFWVRLKACLWKWQQTGITVLTHRVWARVQYNRMYWNVDVFILE